jgi:hypothetical protein
MKSEKIGKPSIFTYIKAVQFFPNYAPLVIDWKKKLSGKNGRGNPVSFSESDLKQIRSGLTKLFKDLKEVK